MNTITETFATLETPIQTKIADLVCNNPKSIKDRSEYYTPFPLISMLTLFNKAHDSCMIDYMEGAILLKNWLSPIVSSELDDGNSLACKYPMLGSSDLQRLGWKLGIDESHLIRAAYKVAIKAGDL